MVSPSKTLRISVDYGDYLSRNSGCFEVRHKNKEIETYPLFSKEIGECVLKSGSSVSVDALIDLALWNIDTYLVSKRNRVVAVLKNLEDDSHVKSRINQYQALQNGKGDYIAKAILKAKFEGENKVLLKYNLKPMNIIDIDSIDSSDKTKLLFIEAKYAKNYFKQIFSLFPENIRPEKRVGRFAFEGLNNVLNFSYYILKCRVHKAILRAKLEPYLGYLHSVQFGKPSLVLDVMELYRYIIDDFIIGRRKKFHKNDFVLVTDFMMKTKMGKKIHLCEYETDSLADDLQNLFSDKILNISRIKTKKGNQTLDTLISEEVLLLAKYLRNERKEWIPRLPTI